MRFKHYGIEVSHQRIGRKFEDCLKEKGMLEKELNVSSTEELTV